MDAVKKKKTTLSHSQKPRGCFCVTESKAFPWVLHEQYPWDFPPGSWSQAGPCQSWRCAWPSQEQAQHLQPPGTIWWWALSGCLLHNGCKWVGTATDRVLRRWRWVLRPAWPQVLALRQTHSSPVTPCPSGALLWEDFLLLLPHLLLLSLLRKWECSGHPGTPYRPGL